jgi:hypothetical protein
MLQAILEFDKLPSDSSVQGMITRALPRQAKDAERLRDIAARGDIKGMVLPIQSVPYPRLVARHTHDTHTRVGVRQRC